MRGRWLTRAGGAAAGDGLEGAGPEGLAGKVAVDAEAARHVRAIARVGRRAASAPTTAHQQRPVRRLIRRPHPPTVHHAPLRWHVLLPF